MPTPKKVVIIGAGFAGLKLAWNLRRSAYEVLLIDQVNYHQFQPLMYQVATARLEPSSISFPLRKIFHHSSNIHIRIARVQSVDTEKKIVLTTAGNFDYDILAIAVGCTTNYFGNKNIEAAAFPMKSVAEAMALRNRILQTFEDALAADGETLQALMNFVIVGGGPTGVELSGALAEMKKYVLPKDYPDIDFSNLQVYLLEGTAHTLNVMSEAAKIKSQQYLEALGVKVMVNTVVENYDGNTVFLKGGQTIPCKNLVWAAGITGNTLTGVSEAARVKGNRLAVNRYNQVQGFENVYALGDIAAMPTPKYPNGHPQLANVAINQGVVLAKNLIRLQKQEPMQPFEYKDKGSMATVGKRKAVVDLPGFSFQGRLAWFTWMFVHLMLILSVKNKLFIFINWAMSYLTNDSTLRLMLKAETKPASTPTSGLP